MPLSPARIGSRRELFVDRTLIDRLGGGPLRLHPPERREVVFQIEGPIENACTGCYNLFQVDEEYRLYYRGYYPIGERQADWAESQTAHLALSDDGIHFRRPKLGLVEFEGSADNNIVFKGYEGHNFCVFRDGNPAAPPEERFKAVGGSAENRLFGFCSADGRQWRRLREEPLDVTGAFDSVNVPLWDPHAGVYRIFSRYFEETPSGGVRAIQSCSSDDFVHWTEPEKHGYAEGVPLEHFYTNATTPCPGAEHILLSFPMRFLPQRTRSKEGMDYPQEGLSDAVFMSSRDGVHWDRSFLEAWVRPGQEQRNWTHRSCTPAVGILETGEREWSMYLAEHYGWDTNRLRRLAIRPHGFASVSASGVEGEMVTQPLVFSGGALRLNYSTSAAGSVRVELQEESGAPVKGFTLDDMDPMYGDELDETVAWKGGGDLLSLQGKAVRIRVALRDADLFALRFT